jgi:integrase
MLLKDVGNIHALLKDSPLAISRLWDRNVETIKPIEFTCFIRRMKSRGYEVQASNAVELAVNEIFKAIVQSEIKSIELIKLFTEYRDADFGKIKEKLKKLSLVRRKAFMFMLETGLTPQEVVKLSWTEVKKRTLTETASLVLRSLPRHITSNFVFWEYGSKANAMPILGFIEESKYILEDDWSNYVMYDYTAEMESFELTLEQSLNLKLG